MKPIAVSFLLLLGACASKTSTDSASSAAHDCHGAATQLNAKKECPHHKEGKCDCGHHEAGKSCKH